jgi:hypothetical protein
MHHVNVHIASRKLLPFALPKNIALALAEQKPVWIEKEGRVFSLGFLITCGTSFKNSMESKNFFRQLIQDKDGNYSLREIVILLFVVVVIISWVAEQFFGIQAPEYMFYAFVSLIGAGCFGYSIERKTKPGTNPDNKNES